MDINDVSGGTEGVEITRQPSTEPYRTRISTTLMLKAYRFDGLGTYEQKEFNLMEGTCPGFCWYHIELPRCEESLIDSTQHLIDLLCPPYKVHQVFSFLTDGPFCKFLDGGLVFRVNSAGTNSDTYTLRIEARVMEHLVLSVSLGKVANLGCFTSCPSAISYVLNTSSPKGFVKSLESLKFYLKLNHLEVVEVAVPKSVSNLLLHIIEVNLDQVGNIVTKLEVELDKLEVEKESRNMYRTRRKLLETRRLTKMYLELQRMVQWTGYWDKIFPSIKRICISKQWFDDEDIAFFEDSYGQVRRELERIGFVSTRVNAVLADLDLWQTEQLNSKLYHISFWSASFLPLSLCTRVFGMNVGGVPWTKTEDKDGFRKVMIMCAVMFVVVIVLQLLYPFLKNRIESWKASDGRRPQRRSLTDWWSHATD